MLLISQTQQILPDVLSKRIRLAPAPETDCAPGTTSSVPSVRLLLLHRQMTTVPIRSLNCIRFHCRCQLQLRARRQTVHTSTVAAAPSSVAFRHRRRRRRDRDHGGKSVRRNSAVAPSSTTGHPRRRHHCRGRNTDRTWRRRNSLGYPSIAGDAATAAMTDASKWWRRLRRCCRCWRWRSRRSAGQSRSRDACFTRLLRPRRPRKCYDGIACDLAVGIVAAGNDVSIGWVAAGIMRLSSDVVMSEIAGSTTASEERRRWVEVVVLIGGENGDEFDGDVCRMRLMSMMTIPIRV